MTFSARSLSYLPYKFKLGNGNHVPRIGTRDSAVPPPDLK